MKGARVRVLRDWSLVGGGVAAAGGDVAAFRRFAGGKVLRWDWRFGGERFFETLAGRAEMSGLVELS